MGFGIEKTTSVLLFTPRAFTFTGPVRDVDATVPLIAVSLQVIPVRETPLIVIVPALAPNPDPWTVTGVPTTPLGGEMLVT